MEQILTYVTEILPRCQEDFDGLMQILEMERDGFNIASKTQFGLKKKSIVNLHNKSYSKIRKATGCPAQIAIQSNRSCLAAYRTASSNKHNLKSPIVKKNLSISLDKRLHKRKDFVLEITNASEGKKRTPFDIKLYPKIKELLENHDHGD